MRLVGEQAIVLGNDLLAGGAAGAQARRQVRANVGLLGHVDALYGDLTVADQLAYSARLVRADSSEVTAAAERVGLPARLQAVPVRRLSTGQRRRLALAVMILKRPQLWLLDEPHAGLDEAGRALVDELLCEAASAGATVLFAAHEGAVGPAVAGPPATGPAVVGSAAAGPAIRRISLAGGQAHAAPETRAN